MCPNLVFTASIQAVTFFAQADAGVFQRPLRAAHYIRCPFFILKIF